MRIDDAILSGSVVGSSATVSLTGSFTGSGHIFQADSASIADTASFTVSASFATTASFVETASFSQTASFTETSSFSISASHANDISNGIIDYATLSTEFTNVTTTISPGATYNIDFSAGALWDIRADQPTTTFTISNQKQGDVKTIIFDGNNNTGIAFDSAANVTLVGGNDASGIDMTAGKSNAITIICRNEATPTFIATINNEV